MRKSSISMPLDMYNRPFQEVVHGIYDKFIELKVEECMNKCRDDLNGMTRFVTWDVDDKGNNLRANCVHCKIENKTEKKMYIFR